MTASDGFGCCILWILFCFKLGETFFFFECCRICSILRTHFGQNVSDTFYYLLLSFRHSVYEVVWSTFYFVGQIAPANLRVHLEKQHFALLQSYKGNTACPLTPGSLTSTMIALASLSSVHGAFAYLDQL